MFKILGIPTSKWAVVILAGDVGAFLLTTLAIVLLLPQVAVPLPFFLTQYHIPLLLFLGINILILYMADLYDHYQDYRSGENISRLIFTVWLATVLVVFFLSSSSRHYLGRGFVEWQAMAFCGVLVLWRYFFSALALPIRLRRRAVIIGTGIGGQTIFEAIQARPNCGLEIAGFVDQNFCNNSNQEVTAVGEARVLGDVDQLGEIVEEHRIEMIIMASPPERSHGVLTNLSRLSFNTLAIVDMPTLYENLCGKIPIHYISEVWLYMHSVYQQKIYYRHLKRIIDVLGASLGLILTSPLWVLIAAAIKLDSPGPVFFRQKRLGQDNKPFTIFKFRTMLHEKTENNTHWAVPRDPRVTRVGRLLRRLRLDELPQLLNVWKSDMSLIGPRAEWDLYANDALKPIVKWRPGRRTTDTPGTLVNCGHEESIPFYGFRTVVRPGITGWAQVKFPMAGSSPEELTEKLQYDLYYVKNMGFWLDVTILLKTVKIVLLGRGK